MIKSKLVEFTRTLSKVELKEFGKYLEGMTLKKGKVFLLYQYLCKSYPDFPEKKIAKEYVSKKLFGGSKDSLKNLRDTMSNLYGFLEDFIVKKELEISESERNFILLKAIGRRKLDRFFFQKITSIQKDWEKEPLPGIEHLYHEFRLSKVCLFHPNYEISVSGNISYSELNEKMDRFYLSKKLYLLLGQYQTSSFVLPTDEKENKEQNFLIDNLLSISKLNRFQETPQIKLLSDLVEAFYKQDFSNFSKIKERFKASLSMFDEYEQKDLLTIVQHICYTKYIKEDVKYLAEFFDLYKLAVEEKLIFEQGYIASQTFINIVDVACSVGELDWAEFFVVQNGIYIKESVRADYVNLCKVKICMRRKKFESALEMLAFIDHLNPFFAIQVRPIQIQCYYDLGEEYEELFYNQVRAFKMYLSRKQELTEQVKLTLNNFLKFTNALQKIMISNGSISLDFLKEIENTQNVACKSWLLEKANELKKIPS